MFHDLRSKLVTLILKPKTNFLRKSISYSGALLWSSFPIWAKEQGITINQFKIILEGKIIFPEPGRNFEDGVKFPCKIVQFSLRNLQIFLKSWVKIGRNLMEN